MKKLISLTLATICAIALITSTQGVKTAEHIPPDPWTISANNYK